MDLESESDSVSESESGNAINPLQEGHAEPDRSAVEDLSGKDTPIKVNRNKNSRKTQGLRYVDVEVNKDSSDTRTKLTNNCATVRIKEQLDKNSTSLETELTHFDRPDATSRERAASPAPTGQTWRSFNSDASYVSAPQSPTGTLLFVYDVKFSSQARKKLLLLLP